MSWSGLGAVADGIGIGAGGTGLRKGRVGQIPKGEMPLTSPMRLPAVEATLTALGFREWPPMRTGDALSLSRVSLSLTMPSAIRLRDDAPDPSAWVSVLGIFSCAAARCDSCSSWDSWLESWPLPLRALISPSLVGGVNTRPPSWVEFVACELLLDGGGGGGGGCCRWNDRSRRMLLLSGRRLKDEAEWPLLGCVSSAPLLRDVLSRPPKLLLLGD